jgi:hypothetical protein
MPHLELTNSDKLAIVDELFHEDLLALGPWRLAGTGHVAMCGVTRFGACYLHRLVMEMFGHDLTGVTVDHRDRNKLDNRRRNLRVATQGQQTKNVGRRRNNKSGFIGVHWSKAAGKWHAQIRIDGRKRHLGSFADPAEAARTYDAAALAGPDAEFRVLNFPSGGQQC